jgi:hypothetical protein
MTDAPKDAAPRKRRLGGVALAALWLAAAGLSVGVGFGAVHLVGEEGTDATAAPLSVDAVASQAAQSPGPAQTGSGESAATPTGEASTRPTRSGQAPAPRSSSARTVSVTGGTVTVRCSGDTVRLLYATPVDGYASTVESRGPVEVEVEFEGAGGNGRVKASCSAGVARVETRNR